MVKTKNQLPAHPYHPLPFIIKEIKEETPCCHTLVVEPKDQQVSASFEAGQFYMLYVFGHGEVPISVSGNPDIKGQLSFTIIDVGSITAALCALSVGDTIGLRGPFGSSWPIKTAENKELLIIAGGLGLAPLRPVIHHALHNEKYFKQTSLLLGARCPENILFQDEHKQWATKLNMAMTVDDDAGCDWQGNVGVVTELITDKNIDTKNSIAMICGPEIMMRFAAHALLDKGMAASDIYVSMERNMKCALGHCGRCQYGPYFICKDGPVFSFDQVEHLFKVGEV